MFSAADLSRLSLLPLEAVRPDRQRYPPSTSIPSMSISSPPPGSASSEAKKIKSRMGCEAAVGFESQATIDVPSSPPSHRCLLSKTAPEKLSRILARSFFSTEALKRSIGELVGRSATTGNPDRESSSMTSTPAEVNVCLLPIERTFEANDSRRDSRRICEPVSSRLYTARLCSHREPVAQRRGILQTSSASWWKCRGP